MTQTDHILDAIVVGGGFGGLGAALTLAEAGHDVLLLERLGYCGGCACTFDHEGDRFEGGATLFAGLAPHELFGRWIERYGLDVEVEHLERPIELRAGDDVVVRGHRDRAQFLAELSANEGAPQAALARFFALQELVATRLWELFDEPALLPPFDRQAFWVHVRRLPRYAPLLPYVGKPLLRVLARFGLADYAPLRSWVDAQCQITVQCPASEAEALFALAALDYQHRGAAHVKGGIGQLARGLSDALVRAGGRLQLRSAAMRVERSGSLWLVTARGMTWRTRAVVLNVLPQVAQRLVVGAPPNAFERRARAVRTGWGAATLFRTLLPPNDLAPGPLHLELVDNPSAPHFAGNHVFLSIGAAGEGVADPATRRATVSTHVDLGALQRLGAVGQCAHIEAVHARMRATLAKRAPEWERVVREFTASPRTYARWVGRHEGVDGSDAAQLGGWVGGVPRRAGLGAYRDLFFDRSTRRLAALGLVLVGDSVFPGQSTLATALGGVRAAESLVRRAAAQTDSPSLRSRAATSAN